MYVMTSKLLNRKTTVFVPSISFTRTDFFLVSLNDFNIVHLNSERTVFNAILINVHYGSRFAIIVNLCRLI